jgi:hypothetical protein
MQCSGEDGAVALPSGRFGLVMCDLNSEQIRTVRKSEDGDECHWAKQPGHCGR